MTQQIINLGAAPNDGDGDNLRTAFDKVNENFDQVWTAGPVGSNVQISGNTIATLQVNQDLALSPNGTGNVRLNNNTIPGANNTWFLGSVTNQWRGIYANTVTAGNVTINDNLVVPGDVTIEGNLTVEGDTIQIGNIVTDTKTIQLSNTAASAAAANGSGITVGANDNIATMLYNSTSNTWTMNIGANIAGNVTAPYFIGNGSLLTGVSSYANANVVAYGQAGWAGNIIPSGNAVYSLGNATNQWNDLYVSNTTIYMNNVPISLGAGNVLTVNGEAVLSNDSNTNITTTGTIAAEILTANTAVNIGTGAIGIDEDNFLVVETLVPGGLRPSNDDMYLLGNVSHRWSEVHANVYYGDGSQLTGIAATGNLEIVGATIAIAPGAPDTLINISPSGESWAYLQLPTNETANTYNTRLWNAAGNVEIGAGNFSTSGPSYEWVFDNNGTLIFPRSQTSIYGGLDNDFTINTSNTGTATYTFTFSQFGDLSVPINLNVSGNVYTNDIVGPAAGNVAITANTQSWLFDDTGAVTLPGNSAINSLANTIRISASTDDLTGIYLVNDGDAEIYANANVSIYADSANSGQGWTFDTTGNLTLPNNGSIIVDDDGVIGPNGDDMVISWDNEELILRSVQGSVELQADNDVSITTRFGAGDFQWIFANNNELVNITGDSAIVTEAGNLAISGGRDGLSSGNVTVRAVDVGVAVRDWTFNNNGDLTVPNYIYFKDGSFIGDEGGALPPVFRVDAPLGLGIDLTTDSDISGNNYTWSFGIDGNLTVPGAIISDNTITIDNRESGVIADISIYSADNILLQGADRTNPGEPEGGDIDIFAGNGAADNGTGGTGGGDVRIEGGLGGTANTSPGGFGGTVDITGGNGGDGSATARASGGGSISITAGNGGTDNGGGGYTGGGVFITAGDSTDSASDRGSIVLASGAGGDETTVGGYVQISIPASGTNPGGQWTFTGTGLTLEPPPNGEIFSPNTGNLTVGTVGNTIIRNIGGVTTYDWVFSDTGNLTAPRNITATDNVTGANLFTAGSVNVAGNVNLTGAEGSDTARIFADVSGADTSLVLEVGDDNGDDIVLRHYSFAAGTALDMLTAQRVSNTEANVSVAGNFSATGNISGNTAGYAIGYRDIPQISFTGNATIATTDAGKHYYSTQSTDYILTIANNASQGFQVGSAITIVNQGTGNITVAQGSGVTLYLAGNATAGNRSVATFGMATLIKVATDTWFINGTGVS